MPLFHKEHTPAHDLMKKRLCSDKIYLEDKERKPFRIKYP